MKRIVKFRGKSKRTGEWLYGDLEYNKKEGIARIHTYTPSGKYEGQHKVDENTVGQCTGEVDAKGKPIYEDDIVQLTIVVDNEILRYKVVFTHGCFALSNLEIEHRTMPFSDHLMSKYVIIGNIHDNEELLN